MTNEIILTISIPTYNGGSTIKRLIDSILKQYDNRIEILVSNNKSTDDIELIVKEYPNISYFCNEKNVGADRNIALSIERAKGKYVWVIGDDDYLENGAISYILNILSSYQNLGAVFVNFSLFDTRKKIFLKEKWLDIESDIYCKNANLFLETAGISTNFLSSVIHNKEGFLNSNYQKYFDSNWVQFASLYDYLVDYNAFCVSKPFVVNAGESFEGEGNSNGRSISILCNLMEIVSSLPSYYSKENIEFSRNKIKLYLSRKISSAKRLGFKLNIEILKKLISNFGDSPKFWIFQLPLLLLPNFCHKVIYKVYKIDIINKLYWKFKRL
jgi:abequosyltransferase